LNRQSDMARYKITESNRKFRGIKVTDDCFDLYSSVGDWLN
jgi:hypothetical protein